MAVFGTGSNPASPVLLVEDDEGLRSMLALLLEDAGFSVITARTGLHALHAIEKGAEPAVIVLDIEMPAMNGIEFYRELRRRADTEDIPVIVVSVRSDLMAGVERPAAVFAKPVSAEDLVETVNRYAVPRERSPRALRTVF